MKPTNTVTATTDRLTKTAVCVKKVWLCWNIQLSLWYQVSSFNSTLEIWFSLVGTHSSYVTCDERNLKMIWRQCAGAFILYNKPTNHQYQELKVTATNPPWCQLRHNNNPEPSDAYPSSHLAHSLYCCKSPENIRGKKKTGENRE